MCDGAPDGKHGLGDQVGGGPMFVFLYLPFCWLLSASQLPASPLLSAVSHIWQLLPPLLPVLCLHLLPPATSVLSVVHPSLLSYLGFPLSAAFLSLQPIHFCHSVSHPFNTNVLSTYWVWGAVLRVGKTFVNKTPLIYNLVEPVV